MELTFDLREFVEKTKKILRTPEAFYKTVEHEKGWKDAFSYSIMLAVIAAALGLLQITLLYPLFMSTAPSVFSAENKPQLLELLPAFFVSTIVVVLLGFVWAAALHVWLKVCKIKSSYWSAYKAYSYSRASLSLFGWIPYIGSLFGLYSLYTLAVGISVHYKISKTKSFLFILVPLLVLFLAQAFIFSAATQLP